MPDDSANIKRDRNKVLDESMQRILAKVQGEMPEVKAKVGLYPNSGSFLSRMMTPKTSLAYTNPLTNNITYDPEAMAGVGDDEKENTIAHELTHIRQTQDVPWYKQLASMVMPKSDSTPPFVKPGSVMDSAYQWRPEELEAFQAERNRTLSKGLRDMRDPQTGMGDIMLMKPRTKQVDTGPTSAKLTAMANRPLYSEKEVSPGLVTNRDYWRKK